MRRGPSASSTPTLAVTRGKELSARHGGRALPGLPTSAARDRDHRARRVCLSERDGLQACHRGGVARAVRVQPRHAHASAVLAWPQRGYIDWSLLATQQVMSQEYCECCLRRLVHTVRHNAGQKIHPPCMDAARKTGVKSVGCEHAREAASTVASQRARRRTPDAGMHNLAAWGRAVKRSFARRSCS
eukprot:scaffold3713_cov372-Prasinococcus_capsulatus_cf.AAC.17